MQRKEIPMKNYITLALIMLITLLLALYWMTWYKTNQEYQKSHSVMTEFLFQIKQSELENYLLDNPNGLIYIASSKDEQIKSFERQLKKLILKYDLKDQFIYIDTNDVDEANLSQTITKKYISDNLKKKKVKFEFIPNLLLFEDGKMIDILNKNDRQLEIEDVTFFLEIHEVIEQK